MNLVGVRVGVLFFFWEKGRRRVRGLKFKLPRDCILPGVVKRGSAREGKR